MFYGTSVTKWRSNVFHDCGWLPEREEFIHFFVGLTEFQTQNRINFNREFYLKHAPLHVHMVR